MEVATSGAATTQTGGETRTDFEMRQQVQDSSPDRCGGFARGIEARCTDEDDLNACRLTRVRKSEAGSAILMMGNVTHTEEASKAPTLSQCEI